MNQNNFVGVHNYSSWSAETGSNKTPNDPLADGINYAHLMLAQVASTTFVAALDKADSSQTENASKKLVNNETWSSNGGSELTLTSPRGVVCSTFFSHGWTVK